MFDRYAAQTAPSWGRRALFLASIFLHVSAGIALAIYSIFHIEEIAPPAISLTFFASPPPPPPPPPKAHHHTQEHHEIKKPEIVKQPDPHAIVQPKKEEEKKEEDKPDEEGATEDGVEGGVAGGVKGGVVGGTVGGTGKAPVPSGGKMVPMFTLMSQRISAVNPHLSDNFKAQHPHQSVIGTYKVCIGNDGHVTDVNTMNSIAGEDGPIVSQIRSTWLYKPQPVPVCFVSRLVFQIP